MRGALQSSGIVLDYRAAAGDLWTGVHLDGAAVRAPGFELRVSSLDVRYFLPSLLTGELPLSVTMDGVRGSVDVTELTRAGRSAGSGGLPVTPVLQELTVSDASLTVQQVPYTLPSGAVSDIHSATRDTLELQAHLRTADGSADGRGVLDLTGASFDGEVTRADVTLARHWFPGASGGTVSGPLHVGSDGVHGDFTLRDGSLEAIGLHPTNIHGTVRLRYPLITAKVQGAVLGGTVQAEGTVNIAARHWEAHGQASPQLAAAAAWLGRGQLPANDRLPLTGSASTTLDVAGWTEVHVSGTAHGSGALAGLPLSGLASDFSYDTRRGVTVQATGEVAQGPTVVTVASGPDGTRIEANAKQLTPVPGQRVDAELQVELTAKGAGGTLRLTDHAALPDRQAVVSLDAGLNRDGWQGVVQGSDGRGGRLEGALALAAGTLNGELRVHTLTLPGLTSPIDASLRADGPITALPLTLTVGGGAPVTAGIAGESLEADLSGQAHAVLEGAWLRQIRATLGPLTASGEASGAVERNARSGAGSHTAARSRHGTAVAGQRRGRYRAPRPPTSRHAGRRHDPGGTAHAPARAARAHAWRRGRHPPGGDLPGRPHGRRGRRRGGPGDFFPAVVDPRRPTGHRRRQRRPALRSRGQRRRCHDPVGYRPGGAPSGSHASQRRRRADATAGRRQPRLELIAPAGGRLGPRRWRDPCTCPARPISRPRTRL